MPGKLIFFLTIDNSHTLNGPVLIQQNWSNHPVENIWLKAFLLTLFPCQGKRRGGFMSGTRRSTGVTESQAIAELSIVSLRGITGFTT
jgi:hypothetical protein